MNKWVSENEQGTRWFFGKDYHWDRSGGVLRLLRGPCPTEAPPRTPVVAGPTAAADGVQATVIKAGASA